MSRFNKFLKACQRCDIYNAMRYARDRYPYHHIAAEFGLIELFKWFQLKGHHIDWIAISYVALSRNQIGLVDWLLREGYGATAWRLACEAALLGNLKMFKWLVEKWQVRITTTPIMLAVNAGQLPVIKWIYSFAMPKMHRFDHCDIKAYICQALEIKAAHPHWCTLRHSTLEWLEAYYFTDRFVLN